MCTLVIPGNCTSKSSSLRKQGAGPRQEALTSRAPTTAIQDRNDAPSKPAVRSALLTKLPQLHPLPVSAPTPPPSTPPKLKPATTTHQPHPARHPNLLPPATPPHHHATLIRRDIAVLRPPRQHVRHLRLRHHPPPPRQPRRPRLLHDRQRLSVFRGPAGRRTGRRRLGLLHACVFHPPFPRPQPTATLR